ncbi:uncharacterized protein NECHADRAFT_87959 [Fusarium vanettenii 77-13-4]|uniref:J domain-containing protein n=1 Tax=Fusarium vanettenii (strain ATCC MYA-4622 / CBS 123669 / FGSC 9596 / NRRL 45880 / 77-13-4) TaxID=660122 RepID=C7ZJW6_FUSV7|nr:uncharacterized protein NECHADRAFT_87959 [Fusarium vanettenii 77-13-4]EEU35704.1 predicted protein [Fusarium vanettenii 77-13-4]
MFALKSLLTIAFMAFVGIITLWQSSTTQIDSPIGKISIHQMHVDRICHVYDAMRRVRPGLTLPTNLYDYLGVGKRSDTDALGIWRVSASRAWNYLSDNREPDRELFLQASSVLLDQSTRSVYDGTFWPAIEAAPRHLKVQKLRELCAWTQETLRTSKLLGLVQQSNRKLIQDKAPGQVKAWDGGTMYLACHLPVECLTSNKGSWATGILDNLDLVIFSFQTLPLTALFFLFPPDLLTLNPLPLSHSPSLLSSCLPPNNLTVGAMVVTDRIKERTRHIQRYYPADGPMPYKHLITPEHLARAQFLQPKYKFDDFPGDLEEFPASWGDASSSSGKNSLSGVLHSPAWTSLPTQSQPASRQVIEIESEVLPKAGGANQDQLAQDPPVQATAQLSLKGPDEQAKDAQGAMSLLKDLVDGTPAQTPRTDQQSERATGRPRDLSEQLIPDVDCWGSVRRLSNPWNTTEKGTGCSGDNGIEVVATSQPANASTYSVENGGPSMTQHQVNKPNSSGATSILKRFIADTFQVETPATPKKLDGHQVGQPLSQCFLTPNFHVPPDSPFAMRVQAGPAENLGTSSKDGPKKEFKYSKEQVAKYVKWCKKQQQKHVDDDWHITSTPSGQDAKFGDMWGTPDHPAHFLITTSVGLLSRHPNSKDWPFCCSKYAGVSIPTPFYYLLAQFMHQELGFN